MKNLRERIMENVEMEPTTGCWLWLGSVDPGGYGEISVRNRIQRVHRVVLQEFVTGWGLPRYVLALHKCDQPLCVNPDHLYAGSSGDNARDCVVRGRHWSTRKDQCKRGHPFTEENTKRIRKKGGKMERACRTCIAEAVRAWKKKNPEKHREGKRRAYMRKRLIQLEKKVAELKEKLGAEAALSIPL